MCAQRTQFRITVLFLLSSKEYAEPAGKSFKEVPPIIIMVSVEHAACFSDIAVWAASP